LAVVDVTVAQKVVDVKENAELAEPDIELLFEPEIDIVERLVPAGADFFDVDPGVPVIEIDVVGLGPVRGRDDRHGPGVGGSVVVTVEEGSDEAPGQVEGSVELDGDRLIIPVPAAVIDERVGIGPFGVVERVLGEDDGSAEGPAPREPLVEGEFKSAVFPPGFGHERLQAELIIIGGVVAQEVSGDFLGGIVSIGGNGGREGHPVVGSQLVRMPTLPGPSIIEGPSELVIAGLVEILDLEGEILEELVVEGNDVLQVVRRGQVGIDFAGEILAIGQ